jgi:hypothetical protein
MHVKALHAIFVVHLLFPFAAARDACLYPQPVSLIATINSLVAPFHIAKPQAFVPSSKNKKKTVPGNLPHFNKSSAFNRNPTSRLDTSF